MFNQIHHWIHHLMNLKQFMPMTTHLQTILSRVSWFVIRILPRVSHTQFTINPPFLHHVFSWKFHELTQLIKFIHHLPNLFPHHFCRLLAALSTSRACRQAEAEPQASRAAPRPDTLARCHGQGTWEYNTLTYIYIYVCMYTCVYK